MLCSMQMQWFGPEFESVISETGSYRLWKAICWMFVALILVGFHGMNETFQLLVALCTQRAVSFLDARCVAFLKRIRAYKNSPPQNICSKGPVNEIHQ